MSKSIPFSIPTALQRDPDGNYVFKYKVAMSCGGCSGAVTQVLTNTENVKKVDIDMTEKIVTVVYDSKASDDLPADVYTSLGEKIPKDRLGYYPPTLESAEEVDA